MGERRGGGHGKFEWVGGGQSVGRLVGGWYGGDSCNSGELFPLTNQRPLFRLVQIECECQSVNDIRNHQGELRNNLPVVGHLKVMGGEGINSYQQLSIAINSYQQLSVAISSYQQISVAILNRTDVLQCSVHEQLIGFMVGFSNSNFLFFSSN